MIKIEQLLKYVIDTGSSDLHLVVGAKPIIRLYGKLLPVSETEVLTRETAKTLVMSLMTLEQQKKFLEEKEYKEISDILKKPMGTVATLINRAKKQFLEKLKKQDIKL